MNLLYFRGGPRDGEVLRFKDVDPPEVIMAGRRCMYTVKPVVGNAENNGLYYADYEQTLPLPKTEV